MHPYFNGVDWKLVAEGKFHLPYEPYDLQIDWQNPIEFVAFFEIGIDDDELDANLIERFRSYSFVASKHHQLNIKK